MRKKVGTESAGTESKSHPGDFPGGPGAKTVPPMQGAWVQSLVREQDPTCRN